MIQQELEPILRNLQAHPADLGENFNEAASSARHVYLQSGGGRGEEGCMVL